MSHLSLFPVQRRSVTQGFTLIEILAVLVIVGIFAALTIPSGIGTYRRIQQEDAQSRLSSSLRQARTNARASLSGRAWGVTIDNTGNETRIIVQPQNGECDELLPCSTVILNPAVTIDTNCTDGADPDSLPDAIFNSEGAPFDLSDQCTFGVRAQGTTPDLCTRISTLLGTVRNFVGEPECGNMGAPL